VDHGRTKEAAHTGNVLHGGRFNELTGSPELRKKSVKLGYEFSRIEAPNGIHP